VHEFSIAQSLLEAALAAAAPYAEKRICVVRLRIGELRQIIASTLREAFALCAHGTAAEGARLEIEWVRTVWRCSICGRVRQADEPRDHCACGSPEAVDRLEGSDDLLLTSMDLDDQ
jgi:hydrogenase nickel incorporation protein HypA/HybF